MNFKNELERRSFEIAQRALGGEVTIEHNKIIQIDSALFPEVASFKGPPTKEVDILIAELCKEPRVVLLVSNKQFTRKAEPAHVQEWCAVVRTMNKYSDGAVYFGLVLSSTGFTAGCEPWATSHNIGLVPPLKGRRMMFSEDTVLRMFERVLIALRARVQLEIKDLLTAPAFFDFVYRLVADFEGLEGVASGRYFLVPEGWVSSFGQMYSAVDARTIEDLLSVKGATVLKLSNGGGLRFDGARVEFGDDPKITRGRRQKALCRKNLEMEDCTIHFIKSLIVGKTISSACDFGDYMEFGVDERFNLGLHKQGFHLFSTENPIDEHHL
jgi:hypothetical protein